MKNIFLIGLIFLVSACASVPTPEELNTSTDCIVVNKQGLFSSAVKPEKDQAEITTSKCTWGFWGCDYVRSEIDPDGVIRVEVGGFWTSSQGQYGKLQNSEIHRFQLTSSVGKALTELAEKIGKEQGPIVIDKKMREVQFPPIKGINDSVSEGKRYQFSPSCTIRQAALGAAAIESLNKLSR